MDAVTYANGRADLGGNQTAGISAQMKYELTWGARTVRPEGLAQISGREARKLNIEILAGPVVHRFGQLNTQLDHVGCKALDLCENAGSLRSPGNFVEFNLCIALKRGRTGQDGGPISCSLVIDTAAEHVDPACFALP
jgi:hypothetical protein